MTSISQEELFTKFRVVRVLGEGSFGKVFLIRNIETRSPPPIQIKSTPWRSIPSTIWPKMGRNYPSSGQSESSKTSLTRGWSTSSTSWSGRKTSCSLSSRPARREASKISRASSSRTNATSWWSKLCIKLLSASTIWSRWVWPIGTSSHPTSPSTARVSWRSSISMRPFASGKMLSTNKSASPNSSPKKLLTSNSQPVGVGPTPMLAPKSTWALKWGRGPALMRGETYGLLAVSYLSWCRGSPSWWTPRKNLSCTTDSINIWRRFTTSTHPSRTCCWRFWSWTPTGA